MTQKLVTAGCPAGKVGNEPSALCWEAIHVRARSTDFSTCCHFAGGRAAIRDLGAVALETWLVGFSFSAARTAAAGKNNKRLMSNPAQDLSRNNSVEHETAERTELWGWGQIEALTV